MTGPSPEQSRAAQIAWSARRSAVSIGRFLGELMSSPQSAIGVLIVLFFLFLALFGAYLAPYGENEQPSPTIQGPNNDYPFGTDTLGRDVFSRVILGTESIFRIAGFGTLTAVIVGTFIGLLIGYQGGWLDEIISRLIDAMLAMPALLIALVTLGVIRNMHFQAGSWQARVADNAVLLVIALLYVPIVARVVRSSTLDIKTREFVQAAQIRGESRLYIITREIFPSVVPALVVEASLRFSYAIFLVASLGFLGVGVPPPTPDWGKMVSENSGGYYTQAPWALQYPAAAIALLVIGVNLMSDGIRRAVQKSD